MSELRERAIKYTILATGLGGLMLGVEACDNGLSQYSVSEVQDRPALVKSLNDYFFSPIGDFFNPPTPTPPGLDKNNKIDNFRELVEAAGQQTEKILIYKREGSTLTFYLAEGSPVPSQSELDQSWDFLKKYTDTPLFTQNFKPIPNVVIMVGHFGSEIAAGVTGGYPSPQGFGFVNLDSLTTKNSNRVDMTEYCQSLFQSIATKTSVMLQERDCNMFGIAVKAINNNLTYEQYQEFARQKGFVNSQFMELEPFSESVYNRIRLIFESKTSPVTPVSPMSNSDLRLYYSAIMAQINVTGKDFTSFTKADLKSVENSFKFLKKTKKGKQKGVSNNALIRGAIDAATTRLASGAVV